MSQQKFRYWIDVTGIENDGFNIEMNCEIDHQPYEPADSTYPGCSEEYTVEWVESLTNPTQEQIDALFVEYDEETNELEMEFDEVTLRFDKTKCCVEVIDSDSDSVLDYLNE